MHLEAPHRSWLTYLAVYNSDIAIHCLLILILNIFCETISCTYDYHSISYHLHIQAFCKSTKLEYLQFCKYKNQVCSGLFLFPSETVTFFLSPNTQLNMLSHFWYTVYDTSIKWFWRTLRKHVYVQFAIAKSPQSVKMVIRLLLNTCDIFLIFA